MQSAETSSIAPGADVSANNNTAPLSILSLWGNSTAESSLPKNFTGNEKRLEFDFRLIDPSKPSTLVALDGVRSFLDSLGVVVGSANSDNANFASVICDGITVILTNLRVVVNSCSKIHLHKIVSPLIEYAAKHNCEVEWASFMHRNKASPWASSKYNLLMAHEYSALKTSFASGLPYLFGMVDSDHYFYFVYDDLKRSAESTRVESDVQLSIVMYGFDTAISEDEIDVNDVFVAPTLRSKEDVSLPSSRKFLNLSHVQGYGTIAAHFVSETEYEMFRVCKESGIASYENNISSVDYDKTLTRLLHKFNPDKFAVLLLYDPASVFQQSGTTPADISGIHSKYHVLNQTVNEFAPGYTIQFSVFTSTTGSET